MIWKGANNGNQDNKKTQSDEEKKKNLRYLLKQTTLLWEVLANE